MSDMVAHPGGTTGPRDLGEIMRRRAKIGAAGLADVFATVAELARGSEAFPHELPESARMMLRTLAVLLADGRGVSGPSAYGQALDFVLSLAYPVADGHLSAHRAAIEVLDRYAEPGR